MTGDNPQPARALPPLALVGVYSAAVLAPLVLASLQSLPARGFWRELSGAVVMIGFALLLAQFLLSGRFRATTGVIGIDLTMRFHQLAALSMLAFILMHPLLYVVPRVTDDPAAALASLQRMMTSDRLRSGVIGWFLLLLLVPLGIWRDRLPVPYELWRLSHGLGAGIVAGVGLHHTLLVGTYSNGAVLAGWWVSLTMLALLSLVQVYLLRPLAQRRRPWRVVSNRRIGERTWEVALQPAGSHVLSYDAGQFVWLNIGHSPFSLTEHPFSLSSSPAPGSCITFTVKESGDFTNRIGSVPIGATAYVDGPHGAFTLRGVRDRPLVFIAGGVGFAPVIGMLRALAAKHYPHPVHLIYGNRAESQILYREEIDALHRQLDLKVDLVLSEPPPGWTGRVGQLSPEMITACLADTARDAACFVCGPLAMMDVVERALVALGIPDEAIVSERFKYN